MMCEFPQKIMLRYIDTTYIAQLLRTYISGNWVPSRNLVLWDIGGNLGIGVLWKSCFGISALFS